MLARFLTGLIVFPGGIESQDQDGILQRLAEDISSEFKGYLLLIWRVANDLLI